MLFHYRFGGLSLASEIALKGFRQLDCGDLLPKISLSAGAGEFPLPDRVLFHWAGYYRLSLGICGSDWLISSSARAIAFLVSRDGSKLRGYSQGRDRQDEFEDFLTRRTLPRVANLIGLSAIHAAAVGTQRGALLLVGPSHAGKSTLSAALAHLFGWRLLTDDIAIVSGGDETTVSPGAVGAGLRLNSHRALGLPPERCGPVLSDDSKIRFYPSDDGGPSQLPVRALVSLSRTEPGAAPELTRLSPAEGLINAARQLILFNPLDIGQRGELTRRIAAVTRGIPAYRLTYPADYAALSKTAATLTTLLPP